MSAWPRLGARIIDGLVLVVPNIVISSVVGGSNQFEGDVGFRPFVAGILTTILTFLYFAYLESSRGQSIGKMALGYKVVDSTGGLPTFEMTAKRNAWLLLPILPLVGPLAQFVLAVVIGATISSDSFHRGWHDNFAGGTAVVRSR